MSGDRLGETTGNVPQCHPGPAAPECPWRRGASVFRQVGGAPGVEQGDTQEGGGSWGAQLGAGVLAGPPLFCLLGSPGLRL